MNVNSVKTRVITPISDCQRIQQKLRKGIAGFCSQPNRAQLSRREIQRGIGDAAPTSELAKRIVFVFKGTMPSLPVFANGGPAALLANAHSGALFALFASFFYPVPASKNCAAKTKKRDWRIFRSRFGKASRASGYPPAGHFHREAPNPYKLILPTERNIDIETETRSFFVPPRRDPCQACRRILVLTCLGER